MTLEEFLSEWNNGSDRMLVHTSGSTGKPKPMLVEKKRMLNSARITCDFLGLKPVIAPCSVCRSIILQVRWWWCGV